MDIEKCCTETEYDSATERNTSNEKNSTQNLENGIVLLEESQEFELKNRKSLLNGEELDQNLEQIKSNSSKNLPLKGTLENYDDLQQNLAQKVLFDTDKNCTKSDEVLSQKNNQKKILNNDKNSIDFSQNLGQNPELQTQDNCLNSETKTLLDKQNQKSVKSIDKTIINLAQNSPFQTEENCSKPEEENFVKQAQKLPNKKDNFCDNSHQNLEQNSLLGTKENCRKSQEENLFEKTDQKSSDFSNEKNYFCENLQQNLNQNLLLQTKENCRSLEEEKFLKKEGKKSSDFSNEKNIFLEQNLDQNALQTDENCSKSEEDLLKLNQKSNLKKNNATNLGENLALNNGENVTNLGDGIFLKNEFDKSTKIVNEKDELNVVSSQNMATNSVNNIDKNIDLDQPNDPRLDMEKNMDNQEMDVEKSLISKEGSDLLEKRKKLYQITKWNYLAISTSICLYLADVLSDLVLGVRYFVDNEWTFAFFTLLFVVGSSFLYNFYNKSATWRKIEVKGLVWLWICPYFLLNGQPVLQYAQNLKTMTSYLKNEKENNIYEQIKDHSKFLDGYKKAAALKNDEALWEAIPQTIIQLYILISTVHTLKLDPTLILQIVALLTSTLGLIATRFTYHRAFHFLLGERVSYLGCFLMATGYSVPLVCRAISIAACMSTRPIVCSCILLFQWILTGILWCLLNDCSKFGVDNIPPAVTLLGLVLQPSFHALNLCLISNLILIVEDFVLLILWATYQNLYMVWIFFAIILIVDVIFRAICMLYWTYKDKFMNKIL